LLFAVGDDHEIAVVDWECAQIGDAAYDLAIVTRGVRRPLGVANGLQQLVLYYNEVAEQQIPPSAVMVHELLLHLHWLAESQTENRTGGHGSEHYADLLRSLLRRARALERKYHGEQLVVLTMAFDPFTPPQKVDPAFGRDSLDDRFQVAFAV
jgi:thiamine kinase-like enzyme